MQFEKLYTLKYRKYLINYAATEELRTINDDSDETFLQFFSHFFSFNTNYNYDRNKFWLFYVIISVYVEDIDDFIHFRLTQQIDYQDEC